MATHFIISKSSFFFFFSSIMVSIILCASFVKNDFRINNIIRRKKLSKVWKRQIFFAIFISALFSIYQLIITVAAGLLNYTISINFDVKRSLFGFINKGETITGTSLSEVIIFSTLYCFLALLFFNAIYILMRWLLNNEAVFVVSILVIGLVDSYGVGIPNITSVYYSNWLPYYPAKLLIPAGCILIMYFAGLKLSVNKELLHVK